MSIADSKKLVMGIGAGAAMEKNIESSVDDLKSRLQDLEKARTAIQQQLEQTLGRYQQDRDALEEILQQRKQAHEKQADLPNPSTLTSRSSLGNCGDVKHV